MKKVRKQRIGKQWIVTAAAVLMLLLSACKAEQEPKFTEVLPAGQEMFHYEGTEDADRIAVDEEGFLYTATYVPSEDRGPFRDSEYVYRPNIQRFSVYDLEGNCILKQDVGMGNGTMDTMLEEQGKLYCVVNKSVQYRIVPVLYAVDTKTWEVEELCELEGYSGISTLLHIGEFFYLFGYAKNPEAKAYALHPDVYDYTYAGEIVGRINPGAEHPVVEELQVDFPIAIFQTERDTLAIYQYTEEYGFGFLEFSPADQTVTEIGRKPKVTEDRMFTKCEDGYLFWERGFLFFGTLDGAEAELTGEQVLIWRAPVYRKGFAFYSNGYAGQLVERICVADLLKKNRTIRLLMHIDTQDKPFGCGYRMERMELPTNQYALKVLAQDSDFDVFVLSTRNSSAYNLKENGAFYALNEVEGVQEYLDACFPYVKELATNGDGDIWMLPTQLAIPALFYNREYCAKMGVDLQTMDLMDFLCFTEGQEKGTEGEVSISSYVLLEELIGQYLQKWDTFETPLMMDYLRKMKEIYDRDGLWFFGFSAYSAIQKGEHPDFYYFFEVYQWDYWRLIQALGASDRVGVIGVPKLAEGIGNVGTVTFLAVNPQAENLEAALDYISSFAKYMMRQKDSFMLADESTYTDTPLVHDLYRLYADGAVRFAIDTSVFNEQYYAYMAGKMTLEEMIGESERRRKIYVGE